MCQFANVLIGCVDHAYGADRRVLMMVKFKLIDLWLVVLIFSAGCSPKEQRKIILDEPQKVVVAGKVLNWSPPDSTISLSVNRVDGYEYESQQTIESKIDSDGRFVFTCNTYVPLDAWFSYKTNFLIALHPGDSLFVEFDGSKDDRAELLSTISFFGPAAELNSEIAEFQQSFYKSSLFKERNKNDHAIVAMNANEYRLFADSLHEVGFRLCEKFSREAPRSALSTIWAKRFVDEDYYSNLHFYPSSHRKALVLTEREWKVPPSYYDYLDPKRIDESELICGNAIQRFVESYMYGYLRQATNTILEEKFLNNAEGKFSNGLNSIPDYIADSVMVQTLMSSTESGLFRELSLVKFYHRLLAESKLESFERNNGFIDTEIQQVFIRRSLDDSYQKLKSEMASTTLSKDAVLESVGTGTAGPFMNEIIADHRGKVILIDVWATWCAPCREEFPYSKKLQETTKDVVFVYVCIDSRKEGYENMIKKFQLSGVHYYLDDVQSDKLRSELDIKGIPHYVLIGKDGGVAAESKKIRPSNDDAKEILHRLTQAH